MDRDLMIRRKWTLRAHGKQIVKNILADIERESPLDLITFPVDSVTRYIDGRGEIHIGHDLPDWIRIP